jgi:hypothetical protein
VGSRTASDIGQLPLKGSWVPPSFSAVADDEHRMQSMLDAIYPATADWLQSLPDATPVHGVKVEMAPIRSAHARARRDGEDAVIVVSLGLVHLIYGVARTAAALVVERGNEREVPPKQQVASWLATVIDMAAAPVRPARFEPIPYTDFQRNVAERLTRWAEWFLLGHELAHVHDVDTTAARRVSHNGAVSAQTDTRKEAEVGADYVGAQMTQVYVARRGAQVAASKRDFQLNSLEAYAGAELALQAVGLLELFDPRFAPKYHPAARERIDILRGTFRGEGAGFLSDAEQWDALLTDVGGLALAEARQRRDTASEMLGELIAQAAGDPERADILINPGAGPFIEMSVSSSARLLLSQVTADPRRADIAREMALAYLPPTDPMFAPFWNEWERATSTADTEWS